MVKPNILGIGYFTLVGFLWLLAALDYQANIDRKKKLRLGKKTHQNVIYLRTAFFVLWFMAAFRGLDVMNDTISYWGAYQAISRHGPSIKTHMEIGYVWFNYVISLIFPNPQTGYHVLLFLTSSLSYIAVEQYIEKHAKTYGVCILAFYFMDNFFLTGIVRQSFATGIILQGLKQLDKKRYILFFLSVVIATSFHMTAIICLAFVFFANRKYKIGIVAAVLGATAIIVVTKTVANIAYLFKPGTKYVIDYIKNYQAVIITSTLYSALALLRFFVPNKKLEERHNKSGQFSSDFYYYSIIITLAVTIISLRAPGLGRVSHYFHLAGMPYIANVTADIPNKRFSLWVKVIYCAAIWSYSTAALLLRPEWNHVWPYHFWWSN